MNRGSPYFGRGYIVQMYRPWGSRQVSVSWVVSAVNCITEHCDVGGYGERTWNNMRCSEISWPLRNFPVLHVLWGTCTRKKWRQPSVALTFTSYTACGVLTVCCRYLPYLCVNLPAQLTYWIQCGIFFRERHACTFFLRNNSAPTLIGVIQKRLHTSLVHGKLDSYVIPCGLHRQRIDCMVCDAAWLSTFVLLLGPTGLKAIACNTGSWFIEHRFAPTLRAFPPTTHGAMHRALTF